MTTSKVSFNGGLFTEATHLRSGSKIITDAPIDNNGKGSAFSPTDLMATSLASCMMTIVAIAAEKRAWTITSMDAEVTKVMADSPRRVSEIQITLHIKAEGLSEKDQQILINAALNCPVAKSLHPDLKQQIDISFS